MNDRNHQKSRRTTVADVARAAGVGVATVDRVLNKRAPVARATAERVLAAAEATGYHGAGLLKRRIEEAIEPKTLGFLLQGREEPFYQNLAAALAAATRAAPSIRGRPVVEFLEELSPGAAAERLIGLGAKADAVGVVAADHPKVAEAVEVLRARSVPVVTLLSELTGASGHVGIDHRKAGRTAGWAIARLSKRPGSVGIFVGSHRYVGHELSEMSFRAYFREHAPEFRVLEPLTNLESSRLAYEGTHELIRRNPDLVGVYVAGGGMEGMIAGLREHPRFEDIVAVCNELFPATRTALIDRVIDAVISTPVRPLAEHAVEIMIRAIQGRGGDTRAILPFELYVAENV